MPITSPFFISAAKLKAYQGTPKTLQADSAFDNFIIDNDGLTVLSTMIERYRGGYDNMQITATNNTIAAQWRTYLLDLGFWVNGPGPGSSTLTFSWADTNPYS